MTAKEKIRGRKIGILGMARSGVAAGCLAVDLGGSPFVSDAAPLSKLQVAVDTLGRAGVPFETDGHTDKLLGCDYLVLSPGVPLTADIVQRATRKGIPIFSELEFASWVCPARIVAVTGSNGKTTTTTLIGEILTTGGLDTIVCGNIGRPFSEVVTKMTSDSVAVVEVSSFQLDTIENFRPYVATILNLTTDHIDRHGSFEDYKQAKYRITENQTAVDYLVLNHDDRETIADNPATAAERLFFSAQVGYDCAAWVRDDHLWIKVRKEQHRVIRCDEIGIKGPHNLQNAAAAAVVASLFQVDPVTLARVLRNFPGVEHRLESVGSVAGVWFVNDSKATNVDSVCYALKTIDTPIYLICGGRDKGGIFEPLIEVGRNKIKGLVIIGEAGEKILEALGRSFPAQFAPTMEAAVEMSFEMARPGETVLLSPGCASFDMFENYEDRGRVFKAAVAALKNGKKTDETVSG